MTVDVKLRPEQQLVVGVVNRALADARAGNAEARDWLRNRALPWLEIVCDDDADPDAAGKLLLQHVADEYIADRYGGHAAD